MLNRFSRTELLIGSAGIEKLKKSRVAVFGIGGVGSFTVEGLVRSGVGRLVLVDDDLICLTNVNRQLHATSRTLGQPKVEAMRDRVLEINPEAEVVIHQRFYTSESAEELLAPDYDYIVDAMDTVSAKIDLVVRARGMGIPVISSMGAGNKLDPARFQVDDLYRTSVCPLAKVMRKELKKRGIDSLKVVYSQEEVIKPLEGEAEGCDTGCVCPEGSTRRCTIRRQIPGSISFVPSVAGLIIAGEVVRDLLKLENVLQENR
ncbi:MAG: tRNA threonylcarbamoyladenosine dehydratase [Firmicutes bacterium]|nr:tRNA threonylcarbamoyladenosine dehydratase [Bacillota bacterium]